MEKQPTFVIITNSRLYFFFWLKVCVSRLFLREREGGKEEDREGEGGGGWGAQ